MHPITHLNFNHGNCSFNFNNQGYQLINANTYNDNNIRYKWNNPSQGTKSERFMLVGDGNYVTDNELVQEVAYVIVRKLDDKSLYAVKRLDFNVEFVVVKD